jgi:hypothetical protein
MVQTTDQRAIDGAMNGTSNGSEGAMNGARTVVQSFEYLNIDSWSEVTYFQNVSKL